MKTPKNIVIKKCQLTNNEVLFDTKANMCLHNETINEDLAEVAALRKERANQRLDEWSLPQTATKH